MRAPTVQQLSLPYRAAQTKITRLEPESASLLGDCPRCGDRLQLYHSHNERRPGHFLGCLSYPQCSYIASYDNRIHELLTHLQARIVRLEAQHAWLLIQVEALAATLGEAHELLATLQHHEEGRA